MDPSSEPEKPLVSEPEEPPQAQVQLAVEVTNLAPSTSVKDLQGHFSYAGTITSIFLQPGVGEALPKAYITYSDTKALDTALLLSDSSIKGHIVRVEKADASYSAPHDATFFGVAPPPKPGGAVKVSNLAPSTTVTDLQDFFAFAGTVCSIDLKPGEEGALGEAFVSFYEKKAVETAVLLTDAKVKGSIVTVAEAPSYTPPSNAKFFPAPNQGADSNPVKAAEAMVKRLVEQGYTLGASTAQKAREFDQKHQLTRTATSKAIEFRDSAAAAATTAMSTLQQRLLETPAAASSAVNTIQQKIMETPALFKPLQEGTEQVDKTIGEVDKQYHVTEKTQDVISVAEKQLNELGTYLLQNKLLAQARDYFAGTAAKVSDVVETGLERATSRGSAGIAAAAGGEVDESSVDEGKEERSASKTDVKEGGGEGKKEEPEVKPLLKESSDESIPTSTAAESVKGAGDVELSKASAKKDSPAAEPLVKKTVPGDDDTPVF